MSNSLRILHVLRTPVGGLFRHVRDLVAEQAARGHQVGVIYDRSTGDELATGRLADLARVCGLGLTGVAMSREISPSDIGAWRAVRRMVVDLDIGIVHGHGAKGGAFTRLAALGLTARPANRPRTFYTPHGGSLHYDPHSLNGRIFLALERRLAPLTDGLIFESAYSARLYQERVGAHLAPVKIVPNGLTAGEFYNHAPSARAADFLFVGELRLLKGVDILLQALALVNGTRPSSARTATAMIVGSGPDAGALQNLARTLGLADVVTFAGAMPATSAFPLGRLLVVPSRAESFPYIVLEAAAAGLPILATNVGGIPEITGDTGSTLIAPGEPAPLASAMAAFLSEPQRFLRSASVLKARVSECFSVPKMTSDVLDFYNAASASANRGRQSGPIVRPHPG